MDSRKLVIIGGGAAGHQIAYDLRETFDVTLIDPKTYWEVPMAVPRLLVEPSALPARMSFAEFMPGVRHVQGKAVSLDDHQVVVETESGQRTVPFDYAVIATGSRYLDPLLKAEATTEAERQAEILAAHRRVKGARSVVVVGGGPVGVETAAEIRETFPNVAVTLVHNGSKLLDTAPSKFGAWAADTLRRRGAQVVLDDRVETPSLGQQPQGRMVRLRSGRVIEADAVVWAAGTKPMTEFVAASWPEVVQANGLLMTDEFLRLKDHPNIFVSGDVTNLPEGRLVITVSFHVPSIVANLKTMAAAGPGTSVKLKPYAPKRPGKGLGKLMVVTLGRRDGLTSLPFGQFRLPFIARKMKSENMFVAKYRQMVGLT